MLNRKNLIKKFINEGFSHRTLSLFSDEQLNQLSKKLFNEAETSTVKKTTYTKSEVDKMKQDDGGLNVDGTVTPNDDGSVTVTTNEEYETEEEKDIETDDTGNPDVDIDGIPLLREKEVEEEAVSQSQYNFYQLVHKCKTSNYKDCGDGRNDNAVMKAAKEMSLKAIEDYTKTPNADELPDKVSEQEMLENWITSLVESKQSAEISKKEFLKTIKETTTKKYIKENHSIGTPEQEEAFNMVVELGNEMEPSMEVIVDGFEDDGHLNGYLKSIEQNIDLNICPAGNIKLDGNPIGEIQLSETDRDEEGEYMGAPEDTTAPAPLKTPTIAPSKPGEKKRRGPFERPKTTPKPKARNKGSLPDWLKATNLGKALTQHG